MFLGFNIEANKLIKMSLTRYLAVLPIGSIFLSFFLLWKISLWLEAYLGIPHNYPPKMHPNGTIFLTIFLSSIVLVMISGYLLGWIANALVCSLFFNWPKDKLLKVFIFSEIPENWKRNEMASSERIKSDWQIIRAKGKVHFILYRGIVIWGLMFFTLGIFPVLKGSIEPTVSYFIEQIILCLTCGTLFGVAIWYFSERSFLKMREKKDKNS